MTRAVVIGASIAGIVAARVLADAVDEVVVLERDAILRGVRPSALPQAPHAHILLRRGHRELERLFPGFDAALAARGAPRVDWARDAIWVTASGESPRIRSGLWSRSASRPLLDEVLLGLLRHPRIRIRGGVDVVGLVGGAAGVTGVRVQDRAPAGDRPVAGDRDPVPSTIEAWLVVDASGRGSKLPAHLEGMGLAAPRERVVDASLRYASRVYRAPDRDPGWVAAIVHDRPPATSRGGVVMRIEDGRWLATLGGAGETDHPPHDEVGFLAFARSLRSPLVHESIRDLEPVTPVRGWARTANRWRRFESMAGWPPGLAVVGDALCALNPVYGQGMTVAAMEGPVLARWLDALPVRRARSAGRPPDTRPLVRSLAGVARVPWELAVAEDARMPWVVGAPAPRLAERLTRRYFEAVLRTAPTDPATFRRLSEVTQLVRSPVALFDPQVLWRVARSGFGSSPAPPGGR